MLNLIAARKNKGIAQMELSKRCGLSQSCINLYENGRVSPTVATLTKIAKELECDVRDLI